MNNGHLSLVCKHKHMLKKGAPPDNFGALYRLLFYGFLRFSTEANYKCYHPLVHHII